MLGIASSSTPDRDGESVLPEGGDFKNFKKNPVILASHNYRDFPIGKATKIWVEGKKVLFKMKFSEATQSAKDAYELVKEGILNTFSIGFIPREYDEEKKIINKWELLEISVVSVPANPDAVVVAKGLKENDLAQKLCKQWLLDEELKEQVSEIESKTVIPFSIHGESPKAPEDMAWDAGAEIKKVGDDLVKLKKMCAWFDGENPENKSSYKLPHHLADGKVVMRGCMAAMASMMGARGGVAIPDGDRKGVFSHLAKHYAQFDRKPPEMRFIEDIASSEVFNTETEKKGAVESNGIDRKLLKKTTGYLQCLLRDTNKNRKAGEKQC